MDVSYQIRENLTKGGKKHFYSDLSFWALIFSNLMVIIWVLIEECSLAVVMWVYWSQSVSIGILWFFKILSLKEFSTKGFKINGRAVEPTTSTKIQTAVFFLIHYGFFHLIYSFFLKGMFESVQLVPIFLMAGIFFVYQCFSFFYNKKWKNKRKPNIGTMMFFPYARIIPMHITIIAGGALQTSGGEISLVNASLLIFMLLKTLADILMHTVEKRGFGDKPTKKAD